MADREVLNCIRLFAERNQEQIVKLIIGSVTTIIIYRIANNTVSWCFDTAESIYNLCFSYTRADISDPFMKLVIMAEIKKQHPNCQILKVQRNHQGIDNIPGDGVYRIKRDGKYFFDVEILEDGKRYIVYYYGEKYFNLLDSSKELQRRIYLLYTEESLNVEKITKYSLDASGWKFAGFSAPKRSTEIRMTPTITDIQKAVRDFLASDIQHSLGIYLEGASRTGKSMMVKFLASEFKMPIYSLPIDSPYLHDSALERYVGEIPEHSIIVIDEFHRKITALLERRNSLVSMGGILEVLDDQHLPKKSLLILTGINASETNTLFQNNLVGQGRIDKVFQMYIPE
jgi:hypothetical protein